MCFNISTNNWLWASLKTVKYGATHTASCILDCKLIEIKWMIRILILIRNKPFGKSFSFPELMVLKSSIRERFHPCRQILTNMMISLIDIIHQLEWIYFKINNKYYSTKKAQFIFTKACFSYFVFYILKLSRSKRKAKCRK